MIGTDGFVDQADAIEALDLVSSEIGEAVLCSCCLHLTDVIEYFLVDGELGARDLVGETRVEGSPEDPSEVHKGFQRFDFFRSTSHHN